MWEKSTFMEKMLWLYIVLMPLAGIAFFKVGIKRVGYCDFVVAGLFIIWIAGYLKGGLKFQSSRLELPLMFMLLLFSISFINSTDLFNSFIELAGLIYLVILFLLVVNVASDVQKLRYLLNVHLFTSTFISIMGLFYFSLALINKEMFNSNFLFYRTLESMAHHFPRIKGTLGTPNMMLTYLHTALIAGVALFLSENRPKIRFFNLVCIVIIFAVSFLTGSRRFTGVLLSIFIILSWFGSARIAIIFKYLSFLGFIIFLIASIITSIWVVFPVEAHMDEATKDITFKASYAYSLHFIQPVASINMFKKHPIAGVGIGTYNSHFKDNVDWKWLRSSFGFEAYPSYIEEVENRSLNFDPHSVYLGALAETGLIGFLGLMYFFLVYMFLLIKRFRLSENKSFQKIISGCVLAGFIGFLLNGLTIDILSMRHFWVMMAMGVVLYKVAHRGAL